MVNASSLFEDDSVLGVELIGQINDLIENKEVREERPFVLRVSGIDHNVKVRVRGKSRIRVCDFPPLRLNFETNETQQSLMQGQDKLKLVTHCHNRDSGEKNLLEEYAAYRIFSLLSDVAFRVRLLHMTYVDTDHHLDQAAHQRFGFVIESRSQLAERVGGVELSLPGVVLSRLNREHAAIVYVFQYLIGNTDWSFVIADNDDACCHNGDLIEIGGDADGNIHDNIYYVPFDFDLAGLVNATYAKPDPSLHMRNVRTRRYRGFCTDSESLQVAIRTVKSKKTGIFEIVNNLPGIPEKGLKQTRHYLTDFFDKAEDEEKLVRSYEKHCID